MIMINIDLRRDEGTTILALSLYLHIKTYLKSRSVRSLTKFALLFCTHSNTAKIVGSKRCFCNKLLSDVVLIIVVQNDGRNGIDGVQIICGIVRHTQNSLSIILDAINPKHTSAMVLSFDLVRNSSRRFE